MSASCHHVGPHRASSESALFSRPDIHVLKRLTWELEKDLREERGEGNGNRSNGPLTPFRRPDSGVSMAASVTVTP